jgi:hypothetical protein
MSTPTARKNYNAIVNGDDRNEIEGIRAIDSNDARKQARRVMVGRGWTKYDGPLKIKVRIA